MSNKSCENCIQCEKYTDSKGQKRWVCENAFGQEGMPVTCDPPYDEPCENWTDDESRFNEPQNAMHYFTDHYWEVQE